MIIVGLTGSIGSGKSFIANFLKLKRIPIYYADKEANKILRNDNLVKKKSSGEQIRTCVYSFEKMKIVRIIY